MFAQSGFLGAFQAQGIRTRAFVGLRTVTAHAGLRRYCRSGYTMLIKAQQAKTRSLPFRFLGIVSQPIGQIQNMPNLIL